MSRIEKQPVNFPESVKVSLQDGEVLHIEGQKGELELSLIRQVEVKIEEDQVTINSTSKSKFSRAAAGTYRSLINNMVTGVTEGYSKELELVGVGYRAKSQGKTLIEISTPSQTEVVITGIDKQKVGQVAAELRSIRPPEPYKGKGVRYKGEQITLKETKKQV